MQCPSCGRPIKFEEKYAKIVACPYCNSILEFGSGELTKIGEQGLFIEFPSIFKVWNTTEFNGKKVYVKGQLRFEYDGGFFDKFFVEINGETYYIREDDGIYSITKKSDFQKNSISLIDKIAGTNLLYNQTNFYIEEVGIFKLTMMKGFVNTKLIPGKEYEYLNAINNGKKFFFEKNTQNNDFRISEEVKI